MSISRKVLDVSIGELGARLPARLRRRVTAVDSHTGGELTRLILGGVPELEGESLAEQRKFFMENLDHLRLHVAYEPRGHRDVLAACVTPPGAADADFGLFFMDASRYPYACGTATVGAVTTLLELGLVEPRGDDRVVVVETPSGLVRTRPRIENGRVGSVSMDMVPSFVQCTSESIEVAEAGTVDVDVVFVGGFLVLISTEAFGVPLDPSSAGRLASIGEAVIEAANQRWRWRHPSRAEEAGVDGVVFYDPSDHPARRGRGAVVYGAAHVDRSPCGTGTAAKMTLLYERGELDLGERFENDGLLGSSFEGELVRRTTIGDTPAVQAQISASAHIIGIHELCLDDEDPFPGGFLCGR